jgi:hypothetical protein
MKAMLLALVVTVVVIGLCALVVYRDPNRTQTQDALAVMHEAASGVPKNPSVEGYIDMKGHSQDEFNEAYKLEQALQLVTSPAVEGTLLKQEYLLRQAEYKLAQLRIIGGDITSREFEEKRRAYADATKNFQVFWDRMHPGN